MKRGSEEVLRQFRRSGHYLQMGMYACVQMGEGSYGSHISNIQTWGETFQEK